MDGATDDPQLVISFGAYDSATGALTKAVSDVDTTNDDDFNPAVDVPEDWETADGHGLHIRYDREVDVLGRETRFETTSKDQPSGNVTYTVYNDPNHEIRLSSTDPVAPVVVQFRDALVAWPFILW